MFWNRVTCVTGTKRAYTCERLRDRSTCLVMWRFSYPTCTDKVKANGPWGLTSLAYAMGRGESWKAVRKEPIIAPLLHHCRVSHSSSWSPAMLIFLIATFATRSRARNLPHSNKFCEFLQMDELRSKSREIEKLSKLLKRRKLAPMEHNMVSNYIYWRFHFRKKCCIYVG